MTGGRLGDNAALAATPRAGWAHTNPGSIDALQVVYKVAERCNINCTYCYYFNMGDESALKRPARASIDVTDALAHWVAQGCEELRIPIVKIAFHGGEPTLLGVKAFDQACRRLRELIEPVARVQLSIQTNGTLLNDRWIAAFIEHAVQVGISIDGPQAANDRFRLDRRGRSTFTSTDGAIRRLVAAHAAGGQQPSTISVMHSGNDYRGIYRYLRGLGVMDMSFLLPDRNMDDAEFISSGAAALYGSCLSDVFQEWLTEDNRDVNVRFVDQMLAHFRPDVAPGQSFERRRKSNQVIIARSDGTVAIDDTLIPALSWYAGTPAYATESITLREFFAHPVFREIEEAGSTLPGGCTDCRWRCVCRGGDLENRFSIENGFDNPSVYCGAYKVMYQRACDELVRNGYPTELVTAKFGAA